MTRHASKRDANHADVRDSLRKVPGMRILDVGGMAGLGADLVVFWQGKPLFVEIKDGPKAKLTDSEKALRDLCGEGYWIRAECYEDVLRAVGLSNDPPPF